MPDSHPMNRSLGRRTSRNLVGIISFFLQLVHQLQGFPRIIESTHLERVLGFGETGPSFLRGERG